MLMNMPRFSQLTRHLILAMSFLLPAIPLMTYSQPSMAEEQAEAGDISTGEKIGRFFGDIGSSIKGAFNDSAEYIEDTSDKAGKKTKEIGDNTSQAVKDAIDSTANFFDDIEKGIENSGNE